MDSLAAAENTASEVELQLVIDALPMLVSFITADERYGVVNKAYEEWFGVPRSEIRGKTLLEVIGEKAYAVLGPYVKRGLAGERLSFEQHQVPYRLGGHRDVRVTFVPRAAVDGKPGGYVALLEDTTERRRLAFEREEARDLVTVVAALEAKARKISEEARARTEFLLAVGAALGESLELDVILHRLVELIAPEHAMFAAVWIAASGERVRRHVHAPFSEVLVDPEGPRNPAALPVERVLATGGTLRIESYGAWMIEQGASEAGRKIDALGIGPVLVIPIRREGEITAVLSVARARGAAFEEEDLAVFESIARLTGLAFENARLYREMVNLREAAEQATVSKDRFLAHVSHDLRNPLNSVLGWSTLLRSIPHDTARVTRGLEVIERNAKAQVQLIEDLLDVSRITSGKLALELAVADVRTEIDTALDPARLAAAAKNVALAIVVDHDSGGITVDRDRFRQIVWNLVSNAVKFTPAGGTVRVDAKRQGSTFRLVVSDTGRGITAAFLPRIFERFEQAEAGSRRSGGLGLGLSIVKTLVELHGGTVAVESAGEDQGSRFTVALPIRAALPPPTEGPASTHALKELRVLNVDDEAEAREVVRAILEHAGATVTTAASADEALVRLRNQPFDLVVSDIGMPDKDGKAFLRELRALPEVHGGRVPAVALTALVSTKDRVEVLAAGFDSHVSKPVEPEELVLVLARLVRR